MTCLALMVACGKKPAADSGGKAGAASAQSATGSGSGAPSDSAASGAIAPGAAPAAGGGGSAGPLSPLADSLKSFLVFAPIGETTFTAASRGKRMLLDIGRVDAEVRRDSARARAYREAVMSVSPVAVGTKFRLRGQWGMETVTATEVDSWNGRIVLRLAGSPMMDSLAKGKNPIIASAFRAESAAAVADTCGRALPFPAPLAERVAQVKDSLEAELRNGPQPLYPRLQRKLAVSSSQIAGCFGSARAALVVTLRAGAYEWVREKVVLIEPAGKVTALKLSDFRFHAHELLLAFDADGDGVDDFATRALTERQGATTILLVDLKGKKATRLSAGFAWEEQ